MQAILSHSCFQPYHYCRSMMLTQCSCVRRSCHLACSRILRARLLGKLLECTCCRHSPTKRHLALSMCAKSPNLAQTPMRTCSARQRQQMQSESSSTCISRHAPGDLHSFASALCSFLHVLCRHLIACSQTLTLDSFSQCC